MRSLEQIIEDNGGDNTPMYDSHNGTGRACLDHPDCGPIVARYSDWHVHSNEDGECEHEN